MRNKILFGLVALSMVMFAGCDVTEPINDATYTIKITNDGNGTGMATVSDAAAESAAEGAMVTVTATPTGDYAFKQWTIVSGGVTLSPNTTTATATFTMPAKAVEIRAEFEAISRAITMTDDGNGTATADPADATAGTEVTITATPTDPANNQFMQWVVVSGPAGLLADVTANPATFTMPAEAVTIKAEFTMSADAAAQATTLAYNSSESTGANTVYTFALPAEATGATIATATVTCDGSPVTSSLAGTGNVNLTFTDQTLADLPYDKDLTVTYTVTYGGRTSTAATTHTISAAEITAMAQIQAIRKATANAEAAKITGFMEGMNNQDNLVFNPVVDGTLASGVTLTNIVIKAGADVGSATAVDFGANGAVGGVLSLNTQKVVGAMNVYPTDHAYAYVDITFTVTLNGVASDPISSPVAITNLFAAGTTGYKLRTDKKRLGEGKPVQMARNTTGDVLFSPSIVLSGGVSIPQTTHRSSDNGGQGTIRASAGGAVTLNFTTAPTKMAGIKFIVYLHCDGTRCLVHDNFDVIVIMY